MKNNSKPQTLLFHNGDFQKQHPIKFCDALNMTFSDITDIFYSYNSNVRCNLGIYLMTDSLFRNIDAKCIYGDHNFSKDFNADSVVTIMLHAISSFFDIGFLPYWKKVLKYPIKIVPMSVSFIYNGKNGDLPQPLSRDIIYLLSAIAERNEIGVRGEYDADILEKYGITNVRIIGCPSLYYHMDRNFQVENTRELKSTNFNFSTDFANLNIPRKNFLDIYMKLFWYALNIFSEKKIDIDLTLQKSPPREIMDLLPFANYNVFKDFFTNKGRLFFSVKDWIAAIKQNDFCFGTRFHGNVAGVLAGIPTLMINIDGRMKQLNRYYKIPSIDIENFDPNKPIEYYKELCDYSEFNKNYAKTYDNFIDYCKKNDVALKAEVTNE